jgi:hypothetical protein
MKESGIYREKRNKSNGGFAAIKRLLLKRNHMQKNTAVENNLVGLGGK